MNFQGNEGQDCHQPRRWQIKQLFLFGAIAVILHF
jgi:hypothetical protein